MIALNQTSPISILTTTDQVDTGTNNDDNSQLYTTPRNHNKISTIIHDKILQLPRFILNSIPVYANKIPSTPTTTLKLPSSGKSIFVFKHMLKIPMQHSVPNQGHQLN